MAYEVTATRKRPQAFDTLVGQEFVVSTITNAIEQGRIAHAYLFSGPRGVGKTTSARILAKTLNCVNGPTPHPCGVCPNCKEITQGNSMDVIEIDGASNTSVNDIRTIKDEVLFPPQSSRYKIYIIDEVHMLSTSAFNALLKTIEEPPEYVIFIFATTETQKVPATIRSRCQQFHFQLIPLEVIKERLSEAAADLSVQADDDALFWVAKEATGSMRDAYTLFDQVVSFSNGHITLDQIQDKLGLVGIDSLSAIIESLLAQDKISAIDSLQQLLAKGVSVDQCIKDFATYFRSLLLMKKGVSSADILGEQPQRFPLSIRNAYSEEQLEAAMEMFLKLYRDIRYSLNPRFELELAVSRIGSLPYLVSPVVLMEQLARMKNDLLSGKITPENPKLADIKSVQATPAVARQQAPVEVKPVEKPVVQEEPTIVARPFTFEDIPALQALLKEQKHRLALVVPQVTSCTMDQGVLTIEFANSYYADQAKTDEPSLRQAILSVCGYDGPISIGVKQAQQAEQTTKTLDNSMTSQITKMFRGEILRQGE